MHLSGFLLANVCNSLDNGLLSQLKEFINEKNDIKLIIIDTLQLVRGEANRNDTLYGNDYKEISKLKNFADDNHICILLIHHFRKMNDVSDTFNQITGTTGITGAADTMMTISKEKRFEDKTILSLTERDIEGGEFMLRVENETHMWKLIGTQEDLKEMDKKFMYENNPIIITINELLEENPSGFEMTSTELYNQILFHTKNKPNVGSAGALTKAINKLQFDMWHYDSIYYESPNANGGSKGRKLYFCRRKDKKE